MRIRITGTEAEFEQIAALQPAIKNASESYRKPQKGNNPRYKKGGDKHDGNEYLLQYIEIDLEKLLQYFKTNSEQNQALLTEPKNRLP